MGAKESGSKGDVSDRRSVFCQEVNSFFFSKQIFVVCFLDIDDGLRPSDPNYFVQEGV